MPGRARWPRCALLVAAAAVVALASVTAGPGTGDGARIPAPAAAAPASATEPAPRPEPLRIMPLGSSSTVGTGSAATAGFRGPLETLLARNRIAFDMVGSQHSGPAWLADRDHEGHGGATMAQMQPHVRDWVTRQHPDVILLQVGTNDLLAGTGAAATAHRLDTMLTTIGEVSKAYVIVAGVWAPLPGHAVARAHYTRLAAAVVARHRAAGRPMTYLDTSALLAPADLFDGLHPDVGGYRKIARIWDRAIRAYLGSGAKARHPDLPAMDVVAGLRASTPIGGSGTPVTVLAQPPAPARPGGPAPPAERALQAPPAVVAERAVQAPAGPGRPLVDVLADGGPVEQPGALRAGNPPVRPPKLLALPR